MSKHVLFISAGELVAVYPSYETNKLVTKKWVFDSVTASKILPDLLKISAHWIVLLSPDISYFKKIKNPNLGLSDRPAVAKVLPSLIPEVLKERQWDWKKLADGYALEAVTGKVWQWIELGEKNGIAWDKITTAKYIAESAKVDIKDASKLFYAILAETSSGKDENVLNISPQPPRKRPVLLLLSIAFIFLFTLAFLFYKLYFSAKTSQTPPPPTAEITPSTTPTPTPLPKPEDYNLRVENASGVAGLANQKAKLLETAGFANVVADTATASSKGVVVHSKEELPANIKEDLSTALDSQQLIYQTDMSSDLPVDIVVILGR